MPVTVKKASKKKASCVCVRMYRHGLGDCFLLQLPKNRGAKRFNILIDCGLISVAPKPKDEMRKVVSDIAATCKGRIDVAIMTHEHWDHVSGYSTQQVQDAFNDIDFGEVWYAWTEDPENALGTKLRKEREAKLKALHKAALALRGSSSPLALKRAERVESILQFFGVGSEKKANALGANASGIGKTRLAFEYLAKRSGVKIRYCHPDRPPISLPGVPDVRVYVLGPPEDEGMIKRSAPTKKGKEAYEFAADAAFDANLAAAFERLANPQAAGLGDRDCPFESAFSVFPDSPGHRVPARLANLMSRFWAPDSDAWRRIDQDWTAAAETLALNLDSHTNNTCLVVAFELVKSGQVLLFAADAQVGNWLSWQNTKWSVKDGDGSSRTVTGPELLERTVFYKVGHHGSHNATLRALGLEQMMSEDLVAFVPVFKAQAEKNRWHEMPFSPLVRRLGEKTNGRLVFSDLNENPPSAATLTRLTAKDRAAFLKNLVTTPLYYEYSFAL